jgi:cellulose synthase/poly-beta-1,6-N-acetylglucosamine synthase-like glycosyltransferase
VHTGVLAFPIRRHKSYLRTPITKKILIQYPIRNEPKSIVDRFIKSLETIPVAHRHLFQLQILDDYDVAMPELDTIPCINFVILKRSNRTGNKAGNMNFGLKHVGPEFKYALIYDSDHQIDGSKIIEAAEILEANNELVCVQSRWVFNNTNNTALSILQEAILGSHIDREQTFRSAYNLYPIFNGAGAIWNLDFIRSTFGGWLPRCVCEDTDLSGEVNMMGKQILVLPTWTTKVDLVETWDAYGKQQKRWIKGNGQQFRYHLPVKSVNPLKKLYWLSWNLGFALAFTKYLIPAVIAYKLFNDVSFTMVDKLAVVPHIFAWAASMQTWDNRFNSRRWWMYPTQFILELRVLHKQIAGFWDGFFNYRKNFVFDVTIKKDLS